MAFPRASSYLDSNVFTVAPWTIEEMKAAKIPLEDRDFCAHKLIPLYECKNKYHYLAPYNCKDLEHAFFACKADE